MAFIKKMDAHIVSFLFPLFIQTITVLAHSGGYRRSLKEVAWCSEQNPPLEAIIGVGFAQIFCIISFFFLPCI